MPTYPVELKRDSNGTILVATPDFPEVTTFGSDTSDALLRAVDAIATAVQGRISDGEDVPLPSLSRQRQKGVALPALIWAKLELYRTG